ncbi:hypothetical protein RJ639_004700 [Escallonia herrerae]|uniref:Uncharacterized protein n=1 Tax=Escallonia herrerae TaxID=1293975 RepID=A0AA89B090_9ASTE|nr:hypothetical protein RJ639_004700 [Escallonia herrerae]
MINCARVEQSVRFLMENHQVPKKDYLHYNHTDSCNYNRWTARPWQKVVEFYSQVVNGNTLLSGLFPTEASKTFCVGANCQIVYASCRYKFGR